MKIDAALRSRLKKRIKEELKSPHNRNVTVKTAVPMSDKDLSALKESVPELKDTELNNIVDESIIAGMVIIDGSKIIDISVKGKLQDLVTSLL